LTSKRQQQSRPALQVSHDKTQALIEMIPAASSQKLDLKLRVISGEAHQEIHTLRSHLREELENAARQRELKSEENSRPASSGRSIFVGQLICLKSRLTIRPYFSRDSAIAGWLIIALGTCSPIFGHLILP
jgi:hypothetical protein